MEVKKLMERVRMGRKRRETQKDRNGGTSMCVG